MKLKDVIAKIDVNQECGTRYDSPVCEDGDIYAWAERTGYDTYNFDCWSEDFGKRMRMYSVYSWVCTDTVVGMFVYFLDNQPVAVSTQTARKSDREVKFLSKEGYLFVKEVVATFMNEEQENATYAGVNDEIPVEWSQRAQGKWSFNIDNI